MFTSAKTLGLVLATTAPLLAGPAAAATLSRRQAPPTPGPDVARTSNPYVLSEWYQAPFRLWEGEIPNPEEFLERARPNAYQVYLFPYYDLEDHVRWVGEDALAPHMLYREGLSVGDVFYTYSVVDVSSELLETIRSDRGVEHVWWRYEDSPGLMPGEGPYDPVDSDESLEPGEGEAEKGEK